MSDPNIPPPPGSGVPPPPPGSVPPPPGLPPQPPAPPGSGGLGGPPGGFAPPPAQPYGGSNQWAGRPLAEPGKRILARIIDVVVLVVPLLVFLAALGALTGDSDPYGTDTSSSPLEVTGSLLGLFVLAVGPALYEVGFIALKGATPGKMIMKVCVVREADGQLPGWGPAVLRWLPNLAGAIPCIGCFASLGLTVWSLVNLFNNPKRQTPFDLCAKTVVVDA